MQYSRYLFILLFAWLLCMNEASWATQSHHVLVSVAPYKFFVEKIAGNTVSVGLMVPAGASAHTYEPTPKEMLAASHADGWFLLGESFEARAAAAIQSHKPDITFFDLREGISLITDPRQLCSCCRHTGQDLHIWLSPRQSKIQAKTIAAGLTALYPEHRSLYEENLKKFLGELDVLDQDIAVMLKPLQNRLMMVSHPAYAYFCRDYGLEQLSIEFEGKDPTPRQLTHVLLTAREHHVKTIFTQIQYSSKGARMVASQLNAKVMNLDPYAEDYFYSLRTIAKAIASQAGE